MKHLEPPRDAHSKPANVRAALHPEKRALVIKLAPPAPPCFHDRLSWLQYLEDAQASSKSGERGPLDMRSGEARFNHDLDFCADCSARHSMAMQKEQRCRPGHLRDLVADKSAFDTYV